MMSRPLVVAALLSLFTVPAFAQSQDVAGRLKVVTGSVFIVRGGTTLPATVGEFVRETDAIRTGPDGRVGLTLKDDTRVALGPDSEMRVDSFRYAPAEGRLGLALQFVRGVAGYISGRIAKLAPNAVRLETPAAIVGVRGTSLAIRVSP